MEISKDNIAQWVIDNRYPRSEFEKVSDMEMYHEIVSMIDKLVNKNLPLHGVSKCKCEIKPLPSGDIELTLCQKCIDEGDVRLRAIKWWRSLMCRIDLVKKYYPHRTVNDVDCKVCDIIKIYEGEHVA